MFVGPSSCITGTQGSSAPGNDRSPVFFLREALQAKTATAATKASPATAPTATPAMAPLLNPFELGSTLVVSVGAATPEVCEEVDVAVATELELSTLEDTLPKICCSNTTPDSDWQQSVSLPQHHLVLFLVPSHGVMRAVNSYEAVGQIFKHFPALFGCALSVQ